MIRFLYCGFTVRVIRKNGAEFNRLRQSPVVELSRARSLHEQRRKTVAFIEQLLLPKGFDVKTNARLYSDTGTQIAEFDVEIRGKLGSTEISWLIECRDRPGQGPAPGAWIEQLVGRRSRFGFNKVTAVSTTGFAPGAKEYAKDAGIEIREVRDLEPESFADWLAIRSIDLFERRLRLNHAMLHVAETESEEHVKAVKVILEGIASKQLDERLLRSTETGEVVSMLSAFEVVIGSNPSLFGDVVPNAQGKSVVLNVEYPSDTSHFVVDTARGSIRITRIVFTGELSLTHSVAPLTHTTQYGRSDGAAISQSAAFGFSVKDTGVSLEMHRLSDSGETHIVVRGMNGSEIDISDDSADQSKPQE